MKVTVKNSSLLFFMLFSLLFAAGLVSAQDSTCTDSDGGNTPDVYGEVDDGNPVKAKDFCVKYATTHGGYSNMWDGCFNDPNCGVVEAICGTNNQREFSNHYCPNGCKDGACIEETVRTCIDTDGSDYYQKGTLTYSDGTFRGFDHCIYGAWNGKENPMTGEVGEFICVPPDSLGNMHDLIKYQCPYGCEDGACRESPDIQCRQGQIIGDLNDDGEIDQIDKDLIRPIISNGGEGIDDFCCIDVDQNGQVGSGDYAWIGAIMTGARESPGRCGTFLPQRCSIGPPLTCLDTGKVTPYGALLSLSARSAFSGHLYMEGCVGNYGEEYQLVNINPGERFVAEFICPETGRIGDRFKVDFWGETTQGQKIPGVLLSQVEAPEFECSETDNGKDFNVKGTTSLIIDGISTPIGTDNCLTKDTLYESYCAVNGFPATHSYSCKNGCNNGACLSKPSSTGLVITIPGSYELELVMYDGAAITKIWATVKYPTHETVVELGTYKGANIYARRVAGLGNLDAGTEVVLHMLYSNWGALGKEVNSNVNPPLYKVTKSSSNYFTVMADVANTRGPWDDAKFVLRPQTDVLLVSCTDTDRGGDDHQQGTVTYKGQTKTDSCSGSRETEYYCGANGISSYSLSCAHGCQEGFCQPNKLPAGKWTRWYDHDNPGGTGDWEMIQNFPEVCREPAYVECWTVDGRVHNTVGQDVICNTEKGFACQNKDNPEGCEDYKVRFYCPADVGPVCTDTDGGNEPYVFGTVTGYLHPYDTEMVTRDDICYRAGSLVNNDVNHPQAGRIVPSCSAGELCYVEERVCSPSSSDRSKMVIGTFDVPCPNGCRDGACIDEPIREYDLSDYPKMFFRSDGRGGVLFDGIIVVGNNAAADDVIVATNILNYMQGQAVGTGHVNAIPVGAMRLASEVSNVWAQSIISVGGACGNRITSELLGNPKDCVSTVPYNKGKIKYFNRNNHHYLLAMGYSGLNSRQVGAVLVEPEDWDLQGYEMCTSGQSLSDFSLTRCDSIIGTQCTDSDGGKNYNVAGTTSWCPQYEMDDTCIGTCPDYERTMPCTAMLDHCEDNVLTEGYCSNDQISTVKYNCPGGCSNGACVDFTDPDARDMIPEPVFWNMRSPVKIVAYMGFNDPFSKRAWGTMKEILENYGGRVSLEFRNFPLEFQDQGYKLAAEGECTLSRSGKTAFYNYVESFLGDHSDEAGTLRAHCIGYESFLPEVRHDIQEGKNRGVRGTPAFFINGKMVSGAQPYSVFAGIIDDMLGHGFKHVFLNEEFELKEQATAIVQDYGNLNVLLRDITFARCIRAPCSDDNNIAHLVISRSYEAGETNEITGNTVASDVMAAQLLDLKGGESGKAFGATIHLLYLDNTKATLMVEREGYQSALQVKITPSTQTKKRGDKAKYEVHIKKVLPAACAESICNSRRGCPDYCTSTYRIQVMGLPFKTIYNQQVTLDRKGKGKVTILVNTADNPIVDIAVPITSNVAKGQKAIPQRITSYGFTVLINEPEGMTVGKAEASLNLIDGGPIPSPYPTLSLNLMDGWYLLGIPGMFREFTSLDCRDGVRKPSALVYIKESRTWITLEEAERRMGKRIATFLSDNAFWVRSYGSCKLTIEYAKDDGRIPITEGWNVIPIKEWMVDRHIPDFKGDCLIYRSWAWDPEQQVWGEIEDHDPISPREDVLGLGIFVQSKNSCTLELPYEIEEEVIEELVPPPFPGGVA